MRLYFGGGDLPEKLAAILRRAARQLQKVGLPVELAERVEGLAKQVYQPCAVAVVGGQGCEEKVGPGGITDPYKR